MMVWAFVFSAMATVVVAIVLGAVVDPLLYAVALFAIVDLVIARLFATGRLGAGTAVDSDAQADPSDNPYARED
jgi:hypothetical protein